MTGNDTRSIPPVERNLYERALAHPLYFSYDSNVKTERRTSIDPASLLLIAEGESEDGSGHSGNDEDGMNAPRRGRRKRPSHIGYYFLCESGGWTGRSTVQRLDPWYRILTDFDDVAEGRWADAVVNVVVEDGDDEEEERWKKKSVQRGVGSAKGENNGGGLDASNASARTNCSADAPSSSLNDSGRSTL